MNLLDCHVFLKNGQWSLAAQSMLNMVGTSENHSLFGVMPGWDMLKYLEFAAYTTLIL